MTIVNDTLPFSPDMHLQPLQNDLRLQSVTGKIGSFVIRQDENLLEEYADTEDAMFGPDTLRVLGVEQGDTVQKLVALAHANDKELAVASRGIGKSEAAFTVVPHHTLLVDGPKGKPGISIISDIVQPVKTTTEQKLAYLLDILHYYDTAFKDYVKMLEGTGENRVLHGDLVKPAQYKFGSISGESPKMYLVDVDPDIGTVATTSLDGGANISQILFEAFTDLAMMSHNTSAPKGYRERVERLCTDIIEEGVLEQYQSSILKQALLSGINPIADKETYRLPED